MPGPRLPFPVAPARAAVLAFFDGRRRDLPWRASTDPWAVLVSEVMLQQTTVAAVVPYYERFMATWPRPQDLLACDDDELRAAWAGLGYYRRAGLLKRAAAVLAEQGAPRDRDGWLALPGVGPYTAAAVASIAQGQAVAAVDGNVERVLCRLLALDGDPRRATGRRALVAAAEAFLDPRRPGDFNQALMELGATVCRPRAPACDACPLHDACAAAAAGTPERWPPPARRAPWRELTVVALLARRGGRVLLVRRDAAPNEGFLELPGCVVEPGGRASLRRSALILARHLAAAHGLAARGLRALAPHRHVITRHRIVLLPFAAEALAGRAREPARWCDAGDPRVPITTATRAVLARESAAGLRP